MSWKKMTASWGCVWVDGMGYCEMLGEEREGWWPFGVRLLLHVYLLMWLLLINFGEIDLSCRRSEFNNRKRRIWLSSDQFGVLDGAGVGVWGWDCWCFGLFACGSARLGGIVLRFVDYRLWLDLHFLFIRSACLSCSLSLNIAFHFYFIWFFLGTFFLFFFFLGPTSFLHKPSLAIMRFLSLDNNFLPLADLRPLLPSSFTDIGIREIKIAVKLIPAWTASLIIFLIRIIWLVEISSKIILILLLIRIFFSLTLHELFHPCSSSFAEGHCFYGRLDDFLGPMLWAFFAIGLSWCGWVVMCLGLLWLVCLLFVIFGFFGRVGVDGE